MSGVEKRPDRRVQRTKKAIRGALLKLLAEKELEKISITEIAEFADVDRKTVYNYYDGIYAILDELETELANEFEKSIEGFDFAVNSIHDIFVELARVLSVHIDVYGALMKINGNARLISKLVGFLKAKVAQMIGKVGDFSPEKVEIATEYVTAGMYTGYRHWFNSDRKQSLEEFTLEISQLVMGGLSEFFKS